MSCARVRLLFLLAFAGLFVPTKLIVLSHGPNLARFAGATVSTLLVWYLLYRLCLRARHRAWFVATAIPALYVALVAAPMYAWATLLALWAVDGVAWRVSRRVTGEPPREPPPADPDAPDAFPAIARDAPAPALPPIPIDVVDLDPVCAPYRRLLFSQRVLRAAMATAGGTALTMWPVMVFFGWYDHGSALFGVVFAVLLSSFLAVVALLHFVWLRGVWRGSVAISRLGLLWTGLLGALTLLALILRLAQDPLAPGEIWFHLAADAMQVALVSAMGLGSAVVLMRRRDEPFTALLRANAPLGWREAVRQLAGVTLPGGPVRHAVTARSLALGVGAFAVEGAAFYAYFNAQKNVRNASALLSAAVPGGLGPVEAHYVAIATIVCLLAPVLYVATQVTLAGAQRLHTAARRAARRPAQEAMQADPRPPILFLRDFRNDQVSLDRGALPGWTRVVDPGIEQANLEDVLLTWTGVAPLIAIGRPGDTEAPVGAARHYVGGEDWRDVVASLMDRAAAIVVGVSGSAGVAWEIDRLRDRGHLDKSVFVLPPTTAGHHDMAGRVVARLVAPDDRRAAAATTTALRQAVGSRRITALTLRDGRLSACVTDRRPSQVEFDAALRMELRLQAHAIIVSADGP